MVYLSEMDAATGFVDASMPSSKGCELAGQYRLAAPFPHIVIDDFLPPSVLRMCLDEFERGQETPWMEYDAPTERRKREYKPDLLSDGLRALFYAFNSLPFIRLIENITGIDGLIPDPYFHGAGLHEIRQGGHLSVHADFNFHEEMGLERRINVLIYLNENWLPEYGGQLELWDQSMSSCVQSIDPLFNRCIIFATTSTSYHGNPSPIAHPEGRSRKSIALYYYSSTWSADKASHSTLFQSRPGGVDNTGLAARSRAFAKQFTPPVLWELARRIARRDR